jgi:N-acetylglucosaminyldiphosphoundecaprenol N-acetyl-beta-D-mannosaminyltransferase
MPPSNPDLVRNDDEFIWRKLLRRKVYDAVPTRLCRDMMSQIKRALPFELDNYDVAEFLRVTSAFGRDGFGYVVTPNVDHLIRYHDDPHFRALYADAAYVLLDSRFLSHLFRVSEGVHVRVCTGSDLTAQLFARVIAPGDRVVLIGSSSEQARQLADRHGLTALSHYNPPMGFIHDPQEIDACVRFVEANSPFRFCFIAVGAPQQEILARALKSRGIARGMAFCIGASVDFLTGRQRRAPRWMQRTGMEWLFRLVNNPGRLAKRYLVRGPRVFSLLRQTDLRLKPRAVILPATTTAPATSVPESFLRST